MNLNISDMRKLRVKVGFLPRILKYGRLPGRINSSVVLGSENVVKDTSVIFLLPKEDYKLVFAFMSAFSKLKLQRHTVFTVADFGLRDPVLSVLFKFINHIPLPSFSMILSDDFEARFNRPLTHAELTALFEFMKTRKYSVLEAAGSPPLLKYVEFSGGENMGRYADALYNPWFQEIMRLFEDALIYGNANVISFDDRSLVFTQSEHERKLPYIIADKNGVALHPVDVRIDKTSSDQENISFFINPSVS